MAHHTDRDLQAVLQYLRQSNTDYAYMIKGKWGSGKTHFWKSTLVPAIATDARWTDEDRPTPVYVSLYAVKGAAEIQRSVLFQLHPKLAKAGAALGFVTKAASEFFGLDSVSGGVDTAGEWLGSKVSKKSLVLCFDDLERAAMPVTRALGYINQYVEHARAKVIILCNEDDILARKNSERYRKTKEKVVRITRLFTGDMNRAIDSIIAEFADDAEYVAYLKQHRERVATLFARSDSRNLRILKYGLGMTHSVFRAMRKLSVNDSKDLGRLIPTILPATFDHQKGELEDDEARRLLTDGSQVLMGALFKGSDAKSKQEKLSPIDAFEERYDAAEFMQEMIRSKAIANLVVTGHLDDAELGAELSAARAEQNPKRVAAERIAEDWYALDDDDFAKTTADALKALDEGLFGRWEDLVKIASAFGYCIEYRLGHLKEAQVKGAFEKGIQVLIDENRFEIEQPWRAARRLDFMSEHTSKLGKWANDRLVSVNLQVVETQRKQAVTDALARLIDDPDSLILLLVDTQDKGIGALPISHFVSAREFVARVSAAPGQAKHQLRFAVRRRYRESPKTDLLVADTPWLRKVERGLRGLVRKAKPRTPTRQLLQRLVDEVHHAREHLVAVQGGGLNTKRVVSQVDAPVPRSPPVVEQPGEAG